MSSSSAGIHYVSQFGHAPARLLEYAERNGEASWKAGVRWLRDVGSPVVVDPVDGRRRGLALGVRDRWRSKADRPTIRAAGGWIAAPGREAPLGDGVVVAASRGRAAPGRRRRGSREAVRPAAGRRVAVVGRHDPGDGRCRPRPRPTRDGARPRPRRGTDRRSRRRRQHRARLRGGCRRSHARCAGAGRTSSRPSPCRRTGSSSATATRAPGTTRPPGGATRPACCATPRRARRPPTRQASRSRRARISAAGRSRRGSSRGRSSHSSRSGWSRGRRSARRPGAAASCSASRPPA